MNEARVRRLAAQGAVELPRRIFKRLTRDGHALNLLVRSLSESELKCEDVLAYPDYACAFGTRSGDREWDLVCVQCPDGTAVRIVGLFNRHTDKPKLKKGGAK